MTTSREQAPSVRRLRWQWVRADSVGFFSITAMMVLVLLGGTTFAVERPPTAHRTNLAAGRKVYFAPAPNYALTSRGDTDNIDALTGKGASDATDLTDGKLSQRRDHELWRDSRAVGWVAGGRVSLAVDLGRPCRINEVAIRLLGGADINHPFPGWVEVLVSDDGAHYRKVAEFSRWDGWLGRAEEGDFDRFKVPMYRDQPWIHALRFRDLDTTARWVGVRMSVGYVSGISDELYVFGETVEEDKPSPEPRGTSGEGPDRSGASSRTAQPSALGSGFTVRHPQVYFHKPYLMLATNVPLPQPIGMAVPGDGGVSGNVELELTLPPGVELLPESSFTWVDGERVGEVERLPDGGHRYRFVIHSPALNRQAGRIYLQASGWESGQRGELTYRFSHGDWRSGWVSVPLRAVRVEPPPRAERLMLGMGWWNVNLSVDWPGDVLETWRVLGLNSLPVLGRYFLDEGSDSPNWRLIQRARQQGFQIVSIHNTYGEMDDLVAKHPQIACQFEGGGTGNNVCPSYRGEFYQRELQLFGKIAARLNPDHNSMDIELWSYRGPLADSKKCLRCQKDFKASGLDSWEQWALTQGDQMWTDMIRAGRRAKDEAGLEPVIRDIGGYNFRPGYAYQHVFGFDRLYPEWMNNSQVSTYSCLYPYHWAILGDEVRQDRSRLPESDVMPWISPGDGGVFPGHAFKWALLECFTNGARGVYFWSGRLWDGESLIAFNRAIHGIAPVEDIIVDGDLARTKVIGAGRVSAMREGDQMVLLVADYQGRTDGSVTFAVKLPDVPKVAIRDLLEPGETLQTVGGGPERLTIPLQGKPARLLHVRPAK